MSLCVCVCVCVCMMGGRGGAGAKTWEYLNTTQNDDSSFIIFWLKPSTLRSVRQSTSAGHRPNHGRKLRGCRCVGKGGGEGGSTQRFTYCQIAAHPDQSKAKECSRHCHSGPSNSHSVSTGFRPLQTTRQILTLIHYDPAT